MELSKQIRKRSIFVTEGYVVADIGTDHGLHTNLFTSNGNCPRADAMDVN